jgi:hypothetical protein
VGHIGEQSAQGDHQGDVVPADDLEDRIGELLPAETRFDADQDDEVVGGAVTTVVEALVRRPGDLAQVALGDADRGTVVGEVVELLRVDLGEAVRLPGAGEKPGGGGGGLGSIGPTGEGGDQHRILQRWGLVDAQMFHTLPRDRGPLCAV